MSIEIEMTSMSFKRALVDSLIEALVGISEFDTLQMH